MKKHRCTKVCYDDGYEDGRTSAINEILELARKIVVMPNSPNRGSATQFYPFIYYKDLVEEIQPLKSPQLATQKVENEVRPQTDIVEDTLISLNQVREIIEQQFNEMERYFKKQKDYSMIYFLEGYFLRLEEQLNKLGEKSR